MIDLITITIMINIEKKGMKSLTIQVHILISIHSHILPRVRKQRITVTAQNIMIGLATLILIVMKTGVEMVMVVLVDMENDRILEVGMKAKGRVRGVTINLRLRSLIEVVIVVRNLNK